MIVIFYGNLLEQTNGEKTFEPGDCSNLRNLVEKLGHRYGKQFEELLLGDAHFILVNGRGVMTTGGLNTPLNNGDKIEVLPIVEAG